MKEKKLKHVDPEFLKTILIEYRANVFAMRDILKCVGFRATINALSGLIRKKPDLMRMARAFGQQKFFADSAYRSRQADPKTEKQIIAAGLKEGLTPREIAKNEDLPESRVISIAKIIIADSARGLTKINPRFRFGSTTIGRK
ncbi:MAG: hypothetical protein V1705_02360 [bacterium]